ncbi:protein MOTHER of FT and TFL1 homolog 1 [Lactuca sativa]|uniref:Phosphatidylethanolamine-binding protein n=1 Tax=Lactuca sativa TaxID=4236 RepID=A0A9R1UGF0_LACSA|nr:protein MOTHER of FT and TFL1 homolog 1 [Lactuca sativa]KAJ0186718.1 hypothetical protein LSAT_V11C900475370 [Lactuca sativa]
MNAIAYLDALRNALKDVMEPFIPTIPMAVYFGADALINSCELKTFVVQNAPRVVIGGQPNELYTLVMIDPDVPNPNAPHLSQLVSWIVTNIPGGASCAQGTEIVPYVGPNPQIGVHRYILFLYQQQARLDDIDAIESRFHFNVEGFANMHNMGKPVGLSYFNVRRQANGRNANA